MTDPCLVIFKHADRWERRAGAMAGTARGCHGSSRELLLWRGFIVIKTDGGTGWGGRDGGRVQTDERRSPEMEPEL